jgi:hypothetical protein
MEAFGGATLQSMASERICCAGTILGDKDSILDMLVQFITTFLSCRINPQAKGIDQGVFNFLVSSGGLPTLHRHANGDGVLTMAVMPPGSFRFDDSGVSSDFGRLKPRLVHQYNRHPDLTHHLRLSFGRSRSGQAIDREL